MEPESAYIEENDGLLALFWERVLKYPWLILCFTAAATAAFAWHIPHIAFRTSLYDMVVEGLPVIPTHKQAETCR